MDESRHLLKDSQEEHQIEYLRHRPELLSSAVEETREDLLRIVQMLERNQNQPRDSFAELRKHIGYLDRLIEKAKDIEKHATFDELTGLPNKRYFREVLHMNISHAKRYEQQRLQVLFIDLDHFKDINDLYGHDVGDLYLMIIAEHIKIEMRRDYDMIARNGGDEFVAFLLDCNQSIAHETAERLCVAVHEGSNEAKREFERKKGIILDADKANVTASIGLASFRGPDDSDEELLNRADQAMYAAKNGGKNRVVIFSELEEDNNNEIVTRGSA